MFVYKQISTDSYCPVNWAGAVEYTDYTSAEG